MVLCKITHVISAMSNSNGYYHKFLQTLCPHQPGSHLFQLYAPLFTEDRDSTSTDNDLENCDNYHSYVTKETSFNSFHSGLLYPG